MNIIFTVKTRNSKVIRLTSEQWKHISYRHPEMSNKIYEIEKALEYPEYKKETENETKYYKYIKEESKYLRVAFIILNGEGFVITSYMTKKIQK